jgi:hypothetical protein
MSLPVFFGLAMHVCSLGNGGGGPARSAMMADLLPGKTFPAGFGIQRVLGGMASVRVTHMREGAHPGFFVSHLNWTDFEDKRKESGAEKQPRSLITLLAWSYTVGSTS